MVVFPVPLTGLQEHHDMSSDTLQESVPQPAFEMTKDVVPEVLGKLNEVVETARTGVVLAAWVTVIVFGLPEAPGDVTVIVPVLAAQEALAE